MIVATTLLENGYLEKQGKTAKEQQAQTLNIGRSILVFLDVIVIPEFRMLRFSFSTKSMLYFWVFLLRGWVRFSSDIAPTFPIKVYYYCCAAFMSILV